MEIKGRKLYKDELVYSGVSTVYNKGNHRSHACFNFALEICFYLHSSESALKPCNRFQIFQQNHLSICVACIQAMEQKMKMHYFEIHSGIIAAGVETLLLPFLGFSPLTKNICPVFKSLYFTISRRHLPATHTESVLLKPKAIVTKL